VLAMATNFVDPLLSLITDGGYLVSLDIGLYYLSSNLSLINGRCTDLDSVAVNEQQRLEISRLGDVFEQLNFNCLAFTDEILFAAGLNNCFFHKDTKRAYQNSPPL